MYATHVQVLAAFRESHYGFSVHYSEQFIIRERDPYPLEPRGQESSSVSDLDRLRVRLKVLHKTLIYMYNNS